MPATQVLGGPQGLARGTSQHNDLYMFRPRHWERGRPWPNWHGPKDCFFSTHLQVNVPKAGQVGKRDDFFNVRLHVESTKRQYHPALNELKGKVVCEFLTPVVQQAVREALRRHGWGFRLGSRISVDDVRDNWSTEVWRAVLPTDRCNAIENIAAVYAAIGHIVDEVLGRFADDLAALFQAEHV
jgi:hypothetical protein